MKDARGKWRARKVWWCLGHGRGNAGLRQALLPSLAVANSRIPAIPYAQGDGGVGPVVGDSELRLSLQQLHGRRGCGVAWQRFRAWRVEGGGLKQVEGGGGGG